MVSKYFTNIRGVNLANLFKNPTFWFTQKNYLNKFGVFTTISYIHGYYMYKWTFNQSKLRWGPTEIVNSGVSL